jgi:hypothetical protein
MNNTDRPFDGIVIVDLSCSAKNCNLGTCPDCGECVRFCNCLRAVAAR